MKIQWVNLNDHLKRWYVSDRFFIDCENYKYCRHYCENKYELYERGAGIGGNAAFRGGGNTLLDIMNIYGYKSAISEKHQEVNP